MKVLAAKISNSWQHPDQLNNDEKIIALEEKL